MKKQIFKKPLSKRRTFKKFLMLSLNSRLKLSLSENEFKQWHVSGKTMNELKYSDFHGAKLLINNWSFKKRKKSA